MRSQERCVLVQPGERAPDFTLPAVNRDGPVSLASYRGKTGVLVGLFRGLECPFCRRQIAQLGAAQQKLLSVGVTILAVVNTAVDRGALYLRYRPTPVTLLADPDLATHRAFGLPKFEALLGPERIIARGNQAVGHFLIDREGMVRWIHVEGAEQSGSIGHFPSEAELLEAARSLPQ